METTVKADRKKTRRLLWRWGRVTAFCARRHKDVIEFTDLIESVGDIRPQVLTGMPHGSQKSDPTQLSADRLSMLKERYALRITELQTDIEKELRFCTAIEDAMNVLDVTETAVVELRYKRGMQYPEIAKETHYSDAQVENIERAAIDKLRELILTDNLGEEDTDNAFGGHE